ncbi:MAG: protein-L-isoaspartate(D-aspartate) O-methyltransferase [Chlamydiota bacterium]
MVVENFKERRLKMVIEQLQSRGIDDLAVLNAMGSVPRHKFVPDDEIPFAYYDFPLPIGEGQTISQPYMVAFMLQVAELNGESKVLEIGTGSGYAAAVASQIARSVVTIEQLPDLAAKAQKVWKELGYGNLRLIVGDGTQGCQEEAPYDAIIVAAASSEVPQELLEQLVVGGCLIIPIGDVWGQDLMKIIRTNDEEYSSEKLCRVSFVPLVSR